MKWIKYQRDFTIDGRRRRGHDQPHVLEIRRLKSSAENLNLCRWCAGGSGEPLHLVQDDRRHNADARASRDELSELGQRDGPPTHEEHVASGQIEKER